MSATVGFQIILILATLLCSLIAGFLFAFASVVMPGIKKLRLNSCFGEVEKLKLSRVVSGNAVHGH
ncbi:MAG: hypothetical protein AAF151_25515, partial [Cyanobacteria bacterium J06656_5]